MELIVEAYPKPTVSWILNGKELTSRDGVQVTKDINKNTYTLTIPKLNSSIHCGKLNIKATNTVGSAQKEYNLNILGLFFLHDIEFNYTV